MNHLVDTTEMYLRTILELEEEGVPPLRARIAERLHQSGPTVSQTVARMERDGLLSVEGDRHLQLSESGRQLATAVMRKHRLAECLLVDVIGLDYADVHEEACRWEHVMSELVERRLIELLGHPTESPYGNPIPGLELLGGESPAAPLGAVGQVGQPAAHGDRGQPDPVVGDHHAHLSIDGHRDRPLRRELAVGHGHLRRVRAGPLVAERGLLRGRVARPRRGAAGCPARPTPR